MLGNNIFGKFLMVQERLRSRVSCVGVKTIEQPLLLLLPPVSAQGGPRSPNSKNSKCNMTTSKQKLVPKELYPKTHVLGGNLNTLQIGAVSQKSSSTSDLVYRATSYQPSFNSCCTNRSYLKSGQIGFFHTLSQ